MGVLPAFLRPVHAQKTPLSSPNKLRRAKFRYHQCQDLLEMLNRQTPLKTCLLLYNGRPCRNPHKLAPECLWHATKVSQARV